MQKIAITLSGIILGGWGLAAVFVQAQGATITTTPQAGLQYALDGAKPGDTIVLGDGVYREDIVTRRSGTKTAPITIKGSPNAILKGDGAGRVFEINHDYIHLDGFTIDGLSGSSDDKSNYRDKLMYIQGKNQRKGAEGLKITNMTIQNAGGECVRFRYFARNNEFSYNTVTNCGVYDFKFKGGGKNGEGVYIGTAPEQTNDGKNPTRDRDVSSGNWIHHNTFNTQGNECVDIKEGSTGNIVEYNTCTGQKDPDSAGLDARGSGNTFRYNTVSGNVGAGVRLGGDESSDGIRNDVYENKLSNNDGGGIKIQRTPQGRLCGNTGGAATGSHAEQFNPEKPCAGNSTTPPDQTPPPEDDGEPPPVTPPRNDDEDEENRNDEDDDDSDSDSDEDDVGGDNGEGDEDSEEEERPTDPGDDRENNETDDDQSDEEDRDEENNTEEIPPPSENTPNHVIVDEDFSLPFQTIQGGMWGIVDGAFTLSNPSTNASRGNGNISIYNRDIAGDFVLMTEARVEGTDHPWNDFSVIFGFIDANNYYYVSFNEQNDENTSGVFRVSGGATPIQIADIALPIRPNRFYAIRIDRLGSEVFVYRNNELVVRTTLPSDAPGKIGFGSRNDSVVFDNLRVQVR